MVKPPNVRLSGALAPHRQGLWEALLALGYRPLSAVNLLLLMAGLSRWLEVHGFAFEALSYERIESFCEVRRRQGYRHYVTPQAFAPMLRYLEQAGVVSCPLPSPPQPSPLERLLGAYAAYLLRERNLVATTTRAYTDIARRFLRARCIQVPKQVDELDANDIISFVLEQSSRYCVGTTKYIVTALRSLLRYLYLEGHLDTDLTGAAPSVAGWRLQGLPKALDSQDVRRLLRACDRRRRCGRRDFAALLLMVRLGLRGGEVAALQLDDIDWTAGELLVRGKGRSAQRLPLPADVGEALVRYLRMSRPSADVRALFLTVRAAYRPLTSAAVGAIVNRACRRAGLAPRGAHRLRHTAACAILRAGASLDAVAQVLRHRSHDTTAIYAKVDRAALAYVVRPWPGAAS